MKDFNSEDWRNIHYSMLNHIDHINALVCEGRYDKELVELRESCQNTLKKIEERDADESESKCN